MLKFYLLLLHFTGQTAVIIKVATGIRLVPTTTVIGTFSMTCVLVNSGAPARQLGLLLLLQLQPHCLTLPNNTASMPQQHFIKAVLVFTQLPIAVATFNQMPKAKHTLPPRIASACPNPHCTSRACVFQNVQKHISQKPDCMAYAQAWRQAYSAQYPSKSCIVDAFTQSLICQEITPVHYATTNGIHLPARPPASLSQAICLSSPDFPVFSQYSSLKRNCLMFTNAFVSKALAKLMPQHSKMFLSALQPSIM
jgi:hypothetical protein